jgi:HAE1 family hydrophobic/amphiphilic exporter-1
MAVVATTLVVIAVFAPVAFMKGIIGQFLKSFGLTICFAMAISLFDALTMAPMLSAYFAGINHGAANAKRSLWDRSVGAVLRAFDRFQSKLERWYERVLAKGVLRHPLLTLGAALLVFVGSFFVLGKVPFTFFPDQDWPEIAVDLDMPPGTNLDGMSRAALEADRIIRSNPEVEEAALTVGGRNGEPNKASFYIRLKPSHERTRKASEVKVALREGLKPLAQANPRVGDYDATGSGQSVPFVLRFIGQNGEELEKYTAGVMAELKKNPGLVDMDTSYRPGKPEFQVHLNPDRARIYGVNTRTMGDELRAQVEGVTPAKFRINGNEYDVRVRLLPEQRNLKANFESAYVPNINGRLVRLADIAEGRDQVGPTAIDRQDRGRYIQISAALKAGAGLGNVMQDTQRLINEKMPPPPGVRFAFVGDAENFDEMANSMLMALAFAVIFIYLVLASLYESFITPFTIMLALPLALCGAFIGLFVMHESLNLFAMLGIIMLLGVASKNSILLVDYATRRIDEGVERKQALIEAGKTRLRPIIMTSMALIAGTIPVAIGLNEASKMRTSMGVAIIGGIVSSTVLSLVVIPAAFVYVDRLRLRVVGLFRKGSGATALNAPFEQ